MGENRQFVSEGLELTIDLVMWTLNGEATIGRCLESIERAVPTSSVCHRYLIDGGSTDNTCDIAEEYGWTVAMARKRGIPFQANQALDLVDTPIFASFEQDIGLNPAWLSKLLPRLLSSPTSAVVQGLRAASGSKYLEAIDSYVIRHGLVPKWVYSIDNNLYRTEAVRTVGGFPEEFPMSTDGALRNNLFQSNWNWNVYNDVVSKHYRDSFAGQMRHSVLQTAVGKVLWENYPEYPAVSKFGRFVATPITGARMASESHCPGVFVGYPLLRAVKVFGRMIGSLTKHYHWIEVRSQS